MRIRPTIIAAVLACGSAAAAWFAWQQDQRGSAAATQGPRRLFAHNEIPIDAIERITLAREGAPEMVFERQNGEWMQTAPVEYPVDLFSMRQLAIAAHDLVMIGEPLDAEDESLEALALDPPRARIALQWPGGSRVLRLGRTGVGGMAYLMVEGDPRIQLVRRALHDRAIEQSHFEWRRKRLFDQGGIDSAALSVEGIGTGSYALERAGPHWVMMAPVQARLDAAAVEEHLAFAGAVQAESFIADGPEDASQYGLDPPRAVVALTTPLRGPDAPGAPGEGAPPVVERLLIGAARALDQGGSYFAMMEGRAVVFTIPRGVIERLAASGHLIDMRALAVNSADVRSIRVTSNEEEFTLARDRDNPTKWIVDDGSGAAAQAAAVDGLFEALTVTRAEDFEAGEFPFDLRVGQVTLFDFSGDPLGSAQIARREDGRWVLFSDDHLLRIFSPATRIPLALEEFTER